LIKLRPPRILRHALAALVVAGLAACGGTAKPNRAAGPGKPVEVVVAPVARKPWADVIEALGTAKANESVVLTAKVTETVDRVNFTDGQRVEAGMVLVELSGRAEVANLEEARATLREAEQQYARQKGLAEAGTIPRSQIDTLVATRDAAKARMQSIRARLGDRVITAPFDGVLGFRKVSAGTLVTPGTEITTLDDVSVINLDFSVPEIYLSALADGLAVSARSAAWPGRHFDGTISSIDSRVDPVTRAVIVRAELPNAEGLLRPGMLLGVEVASAPRAALVVPEIAVGSSGTQQFVFRVEADGSAKQVRITLGARRAGEVEVLSGLEEGQQVVTDGLVRMRDGIKVVARAAAPAAVPASG
jgi:membrane fusion protein (multidrug efflux system)